MSGSLPLRKEDKKNGGAPAPVFVVVSGDTVKI